MDSEQTQTSAVSTLYALEIAYTLAEDPMPRALRDKCRTALSAAAAMMTDAKAASRQQLDLFHKIPFPGSAAGTVSYDDRRYIVSFLPLFDIAKARDPNIVSETVVRATAVLDGAAREEWIDAPTDLWDDGRPLVCYSQDALVGLVKHALQGEGAAMNLTETDLLITMREVLQSDEIVSTLCSDLVDKCRRRLDQARARSIQ